MLPFPCSDIAGRLPLLITGITGVAGYNALYYFQGRYPGQVMGIRPRRTWQMTGEDVIGLDVEDGAGLRALFEAYRFQSVLNLTGNCALKACECAPAMARHLNVDSAANVLDNVVPRNVRLVHLSSDLVYSGAGTGGYVETDAVDPVTVYGKTMVEAETLIRERCPHAAIVRTSLPMGRSFNGHAGAIDWIQSRFRHGRPATLYFDEVRSCTYTDDLNLVFERLLAGDESGIYHLGAPHALTLYQIAQVVNRVGGYDPRLLHGCPRVMAGPMPPRAGNVSMCSAKLIAAVGGNPFHDWPVGAELFPAHSLWHFDRPHGDMGSIHKVAQRLYTYPAIGSSAACG